jgi:hypothetical protein
VGETIEVVLAAVSPHIGPQSPDGSVTLELIGPASLTSVSEGTDRIGPTEKTTKALVIEGNGTQSTKEVAHTMAERYRQRWREGMEVYLKATVRATDTGTMWLLFRTTLTVGPQGNRMHVNVPVSGETGQQGLPMIWMRIEVEA